jgi:hypothetical protein
MFAVVLVCSRWSGSLPAAEEARDAIDGASELPWYSSYAEAVEVARREAKMLLICFHHPGKCEICEQFAQEALAHPDTAGKLKHYVRARLPVNTKIPAEEGEIAVLEHAAFAEMQGRPGVAIIDFADHEAPYYGYVVSTFPFLTGRPYTPREMAVMLDLPRGTLTQRTLVYAVRTHPDGPASTEGELAPYLAEEARRHSEHQARIRRQGHHNWERRFHRINGKLPRGLLACEVCAESWPGEGLVEAAIECVRCWRLSSGHWRAVRGRHPVYGYDMKRGSNGVWYATGVFGGG